MHAFPPLLMPHNVMLAGNGYTSVYRLAFVDTVFHCHILSCHTVLFTMSYLAGCVATSSRSTASISCDASTPSLAARSSSARWRHQHTALAWVLNEPEVVPMATDITPSNTRLWLDYHVFGGFQPS